MATEISIPLEKLNVAEILHTLEIDAGVHTGVSEPYLVIPGNYGPRWLIPARSRSAAAVLGIWRPYNIFSRIKWLVVRMAAHAGVLQLVRSVSRVEASRKGAMLWFERCGIQSQTGEMVVLIGNPSPDRKFIAFLINDARQIAAVLKVGVSVGGGLSVLHEAEVLLRLEPYSWAPKILSIHPDLRATAQEYVDGAMPGRRLRPEYLDLLCQLPRDGGSKNLTDVASEMANRLHPFKVQLDKIAPDVLDRSLGCLDLDISIPTMLVHGDFAPWNVRNHPKKGYVLVDWEWADFAGLPAYDLLHFQFSDDRHFGEKAGGYPAIRSRSICAEYFRRMDLDAEYLPRLSVAYLLSQLESDCKYRGCEQTGYTLRQLAVAVEELGAVSQKGVQMPAQQVR
jgi:hypothetical protein